MAKCSREQRDRAVDLYIKYECCAADVIHELGYPSKGALLSWYADRLEGSAPASPPGTGSATGATATSRNRPRWTITSNTADGSAAPCGCSVIRKARSCSWRGSTGWRPANAN